MDNSQMSDQINNVNQKLDVLIEKVNAMEVSNARREEKQDALLNTVNEMKVAAKEHYQSDEARFGALVKRQENSEQEVNGIKVRYRTIAWVIGLIAVVPQLIKFLFGR